MKWKEIVSTLFTMMMMMKMSVDIVTNKNKKKTAKLTTAGYFVVSLCVVLF